MSYQSDIQKDLPYVFNSLDSVPTADRRGSLVYGSGTSALLTESNKVITVFPGFVNSRRRKNFALEAWFRPVITDGETIVLGHQEGDGILWDGSIKFRLKLTNSTIELSYLPTIIETFHVVAEYTKDSMSLHVNGVTVAYILFTEEEKADSYISFIHEDELVSGSGTSTLLIDALAMYVTQIPGNMASDHYSIGQKVNPIMETVLTFRGATAELTRQSIPHLYARAWGEGFWEGKSSGAYINDGLRPTEPGGEWHGSVLIGQTVNSVTVEWQGAGSFLVETNADGAGWVLAENGKSVASGTVGEVEVRITFATMDDVVTTLFIGGTTLERTQLQGSARTLSFDGGIAGGLFYPLNQKEVIGAQPPLTINPMAEDVNTNVYAIEAWIKPDAADTVASWVSNAGTRYVNGVVATTLKVKEWNHVLVVLTTPGNVSYTLNGTGRIGMVNVYDQALTAANVLDIYQTYFGAADLEVVTPGAFNIVDSSQPFELYSYEWSIIGAG